MQGEGAVVLDIGKTHSKLTLWDGEGGLVDTLIRANRRVRAADYAALDVEGIESWLAEGLRRFGSQRRVSAIVPVAHGAAAALICGDRLLMPPIDYEDPLSPDSRAAYGPVRDPFAQTGSPLLPDGLNLGAQLLHLERLRGAQALRFARLVTWPQFWAWRLTGVAATEVSSLGCHTDLWNPRHGCPSEMAVSGGWASRMAPLRRAGEVLGTVTPEWAHRAGLPADCRVLCGAHDSNAALHAVRMLPELAGADLTVLSTGTWFVAMRCPVTGATAVALSEARDCLVNVDVDGRPVPSARFMGGREAERLLDGAGFAGDGAFEAVAGVTAAGIMALPSFVPGVGPFANSIGRWEGGAPGDPLRRRAAVSLYLALVADSALSLIGSADTLVVEGRFAADDFFTSALAALRPRQRVFAASGGDGVAAGALQLLGWGAPQAGALRPVEPLALDLAAYAARWRALAQAGAA
jgi:sugar (pentulose or hexulose) kinase